MIFRRRKREREEERERETEGREGGRERWTLYGESKTLLVSQTTSSFLRVKSDQQNSLLDLSERHSLPVIHSLGNTACNSRARVYNTLCIHFG